MVRVDPDPSTLRLAQSNARSSISNSLESTYQEKHLLGYGFDLLKGETVANGMEPFEIETSKTKETYTDIRSVASETEMQRELDLSVKGDYDLDGTKIGLSAEYINKIEASTKTICLIAEYSSAYAGYSVARPGDYRLKPDAIKYFEDNGEEKFQRRYGQYFTAGHKLGSRFFAIYRCTASDVSRFDQFKASVSASAPQLFSAEGAVDFSQLMKKHSVSVEISVLMVGIPSDKTPPPIKKYDPQNVLEMLNWFIANEVGQPIQTLFMSYSNVLQDFSNKIDVSPDLVARLRQLYQNYWLIKFMNRSVPDYYRSAMRETFNGFVAGVEANRSEFMTDAALADKYYNQSRNLISEYESILMRESVYYRIEAGMRDAPEPKTSKKVEESGQGTRHYGLTVFDSDIGGFITSTTKRLLKEWKFLTTVDAKYHWEKGNEAIVGWKVQSRKDHNGYWKKTSSGQAVFGSRFDLYCESEGTRGIDYQVTVYSIDRSQFRFGAVALADEEKEFAEAAE